MKRERSKKFNTWLKSRLELEKLQKKSSSFEQTHQRRWHLFEFLLKIFSALLKLSGLWYIGLKNAKSPALTELELSFKNLPPKFDGYRILHISDFHLDNLQELPAKALALLKNKTYDIALFTGDYTTYTKGTPIALNALKELVSGLNPSDGAYAVLGNHDSARMIKPLEQAGLKVLINESMTINKEQEKIEVTGLDDVYYYFTRGIFPAIENSSNNFKIILVHSDGMARHASDNDYSLYLCGHTHGGQICPTKNFPLITHGTARSRASGVWKENSMTGFTTRGLGSSGINIRFNCPPEVAILTLKRDLHSQ